MNALRRKRKHIDPTLAKAGGGYIADAAESVTIGHRLNRFI